jgi:hypothetical protein
MTDKIIGHHYSAQPGLVPGLLPNVWYISKISDSSVHIEMWGWENAEQAVAWLDEKEAVDVAATHLYVCRLRQHARNALAYGATEEEVLEVIEPARLLGLHTCTAVHAKWSVEPPRRKRSGILPLVLPVAGATTRCRSNPDSLVRSADSFGCWDTRGTSLGQRPGLRSQPPQRLRWSLSR